MAPQDLVLPRPLQVALVAVSAMLELPCLLQVALVCQHLVFRVHRLLVPTQGLVPSRLLQVALVGHHLDSRLRRLLVRPQDLVPPQLLEAALAGQHLDSRLHRLVVGLAVQPLLVVGLAVQLLHLNEWAAGSQLVPHRQVPVLDAAQGRRPASRVAKRKIGWKKNAINASYLQANKKTLPASLDKI